MAYINRRGMLSLLAAMAVPGALRAATARVAVGDGGVAIDGFDTMAYWRIAAPLPGAADNSVEWRGVRWHFASPENAQSFAEAPQQFAPQFGGFCTRAMSFGKVVNGDPQVWRLYEGRLYFFALAVGGEKFDQGQEAMIAKAQSQWDALD